ncbi:MAG: hypothetical protein AAGI23_18060 [Bacteroidota bacterium]
MKLLFYLSILTLLLTSCQQNVSIEPLVTGQNYYPLEVGKYITYQVDSVLFDPTDGRTVRDSSSNQIRETVVDSWTAEDGKAMFRIERAIYEADTDEWRVTDVYATYADELEAVRVEENLSFTKMKFPFREGQRWEGLNFNPNLEVFIADEPIEMFKNWGSVTRTIGEPMQIDDFNFTAVTKIELANDTNAIELRTGFEYYARNIGLVYRELYILDTQNTLAADDVVWADKAEEGFLMTQKVVDFN